MQEWKELEGQKSNLEEAHIQNFHWNGHSLNTAACWTPLTLATFGLAQTLCQSTFPPIKVLPTFAEKQIGRVMLGTWAWPKARPLPHNFFPRLVICSLFYMFCVWLCAKTELRLIPQSKFLFARAVLMLCVFNGLSKHTAKQLSSALQAQSSCPSRWVLRSLSSPSHGFHLLLLPMSCGNVRPGKKHEMTPLYQWRLATLTRIFQAPLLRPTTIRSTSNWPLVKKASWGDTNFLKLNLFFLYLHSLWHPNPVFIHFPFYSLWLSYDLLNLPAFCMFPMNHVLSGSQVWVSLRALQI